MIAPTKQARFAAPRHLWWVGAAGAVWSLIGVAGYLAAETGLAQGVDLPSEQLNYFENIPAWAVAFWALGVWGSLLGAIALLFRSRLAVMLFAASIIGMLGTTMYQRAFSDLPQSMQTPGQNLFAVTIWLVTFALFAYANRMAAKGVLR
ncbi:hypothetical protein [Erythrobacter sp.]|jgi:hypothetical protein|uniref:hypothetical protein n=1 Tax=Erythrobacter sp. TaxID=1042 RepID=UPI002EAE0A39|nr:hypothetical protein [Erythrobacter sp.]